MFAQESLQTFHVSALAIQGSHVYTEFMVAHAPPCGFLRYLGNRIGMQQKHMVTGGTQA